MTKFALPESVSKLVERLQVVELTWQRIPIQIPKFAVYAVIHQPVFDRVMYRNQRSIGVIKQGRYNIPVLDPFRGDMSIEPNYVVVVSHCKGNKFGLFGYPADDVDVDLELPFYHRSVEHIVKDFV